MAPRVPGRVLTQSFYSRNTLKVARSLLGCTLVRRIGETWLWGKIVETEAYRGEDDPACHAAAGRTPRTALMYGPPGRAYVYFNYGMHHLLNVVTEKEGYPAAVLIRALEPLGGLSEMAAFRKRETDLCRGPARLCQALAITLAENGARFRGGPLWIRESMEAGYPVSTGPRIGISKGTERPWRFWITDSVYVSG